MFFNVDTVSRAIDIQVYISDAYGNLVIDKRLLFNKNDAITSDLLSSILLDAVEKTRYLWEVHCALQDLKSYRKSKDPQNIIRIGCDNIVDYAVIVYPFYVKADIHKGITHD